MPKSGRLEQLKNLFYFYKTEFTKNSLFYRLYLDKRSDVFDTTKFITDPWEGNAKSGKNILSREFFNVKLNHPMDVFDIFSQRKWKEANLISDFFWLRDVQALGGNNGRKFAQKLISSFISGYRKTRKFWQCNEIWSCAILGERIVNWIFSYTFFASGSGDNFQREVLSSINEQFSHLMKCHKAEFNPYSKLIALKGILFCLCVMKITPKKKVSRILNEICKLIEGLGNNMILLFSPIDYFHIFRSLLEVRFIVKSNNIDIPQIFQNTLSKMAANIRFLRMGNGEITMLSGNSNESKLFIPTSRIIDTALSIVDIRDNADQNMGFEKLTGKKATLIIRTSPYNMRSIFSPKKEPGINIFDFELGFGAEKLINRADISVLYRGHRIRLASNSQNFSRKDKAGNELSFEGETQFFNSLFKFALKRELKCFFDSSRVEGHELIFLSSPNSEFFIRFILNENANLTQIDERNIIVTLNHNEYSFKFIVKENFNLQIKESRFPVIEFSSVSNGKNEAECNWIIEERI